MPSKRRWTQRFGPGFLVMAAFVGPGTVTTASVAGADFGLALAWAIAFSVVATIVLQEMSARLGLVTGRGLGEAVRQTLAPPVARQAAAVLIVAAVVFGNAAFQTGNIAGAALGLEALSGASPRFWALGIGAAAGVLLATGRYRLIQRVLVGLVVVMSLAFLGTAVLAGPRLPGLMAGGLKPGLPGESLVTVIALIGTTVVPYNLFLHAAAVSEKWPASTPVSESLPQARLDTVVSVALGGLVTLAIMVTSAATFFGTQTTIQSAGDMAAPLRPLLGPLAGRSFAVGLLAAGVTSAMTAPLAAAYAAAGVLGWEAGLGHWKARTVWMTVLAIGTLLAWWGERPVAAILFAQAANGILLPVIAVFLLAVMNRRDLLGPHVNGWAGNLFGAAVVLFAAGLGVFQLLRVAGLATG